MISLVAAGRLRSALVRLRFVVASAFVGVALAPSLNAASLVGRVVNAVGGSYLNNARVTLTESGREGLTDNTGEFRFEGVSPGSVTVRVEVAGFAPQTKAIVVSDSAPSLVDFSMAIDGQPKPGAESSVVQLSSFVVESKREINGSAIALNERRNAANLVNVISADEFGDSPEANAAELLKQMPGVAIGYNGSDPRFVSMRGLPNYGTPVLFDGAPMATSTGGRETEFNQVSLNNAARIEVLKSPLPDTRADSVGGSINIVARNAFERSKPILNYRANLSANLSRWDGGDYLSLGRTPSSQGPNHKVFPGFDVNYLKPLGKNLGFTLSAVSSSQFTPDPVLTSTWSPTQSGTSLTTADRPFLRSVGLQNGLRQMHRRSVGGTLDWRPAPRDVINIGVQYNWQRAIVDQDLQTLSVIGSRSDVRSFSPTSVQSGLGASSITHAMSSFDRVANSYNLQVKHRHNGSTWSIEDGASFSESWAGDYTWKDGVIKTINLSATGVTLGLDGIQDSIPRSITSQSSTGAPWDWQNLGNYRITTATTSPTGLTRNATASARISAARSVEWGVPTRVKVGLDWRRESRDFVGGTSTYTFVGPDRVANSADDAASRYDLVSDSWSRISLPFGLGRPQRPAPEKSYALLNSRPEYWTANDATAISSQATASQKVNEHVLSGYFRGDVSLLQNRLKLVGGVRYEATLNEGWGVLNDLSRTYQKDSSGKIIRAANGTPVKVAGDAAALARLQYVDRGSYAKSNYGDFYPSFNATYLLTERLMLRGSYARTITRPQLSNIIPSISATDPTVTTSTPTITVTNIGLRPWYSNSFDLGLEYYFAKPGVLSIGVFRKDISNFFGSVRAPVTAAQLAEWGFDDTYANYDVVTTTNVGDARVSGVEYEYRHTLPWIPERWGNVLVNFNATTLRVEGAAANTLNGFLPLTVNYGFTYTLPRFTLRANWNHLGRTPLGLITGTNVEEGTRNQRTPRTALDVNCEIRLTPRFAFSANIRNITNVAWRQDAYGPNTPSYARGTRWVQYGANAVAGFKGTF